MLSAHKNNNLWTQLDHTGTKTLPCSTWRRSWWWKHDVYSKDKVFSPFLLFLCPLSSSVLFSHSVMSDSLWPRDCSMPSFPVHHQLPELAQTRVHCVGDAIQPSHPLSSRSPPALNLSSTRLFLFQWVSSSHQVAKVLEFQLQHQCFQWVSSWSMAFLTHLLICLTSVLF